MEKIFQTDLTLNQSLAEVLSIDKYDFCLYVNGSSKQASKKEESDRLCKSVLSACRYQCDRKLPNSHLQVLKRCNSTTASFRTNKVSCVTVEGIYNLAAKSIKRNHSPYDIWLFPRLPSLKKAPPVRV